MFTADCRTANREIQHMELPVTPTLNEHVLLSCVDLRGIHDCSHLQVRPIHSKKDKNRIGGQIGSVLRV